MLATSWAYLGAMVSAPMVGRVIDRTGSRLILRAALAQDSLLVVGALSETAGQDAPALISRPGAQSVRQVDLVALHSSLP